MAANTTAKVTLSLVDLTQDRIKTLRRDLEELAKLRGQTATTQDQRDESATFARQASGLRNVEREASATNRSLGSLKNTISSMGSRVGGAAQGLVGGAISGVGLGSAGAVVGALASGNIQAAAVAVGAIIGQSVKMAYEFEKASARAAQNLSVGFGGSLQANVATLQRAAYGGAKYNISAQEMMGAISAYGQASGAGVAASAAAGKTIGLYSRAYGLDPTQLGGMLGGVTALSGRSAKDEAAGMFGAAEGAGALGRRLTEFIGVATSTLASVQAADARGNYSGADAANMVANISKTGGYFGTAAGAQAFVGASQSMTNGMSSSMRNVAMARMAGVSASDIILERGGPVNNRKIGDMMLQNLGGSVNSLPYQAAMAARFGPETARTIVDAVNNARNGSQHMKGTDQEIYDRLTSTKGGLSGKGEEDNAQKKFAQYQETVLAKYDKLGTDIENKELQVGQHILAGLASSVDALDKLIKGDWKGGISELIGSNKALIVALVASAVVNAGGKMLLKNLIGKAATRLLAGAGEEAAVTLGEGAAVEGTVAGAAVAGEGVVAGAGIVTGGLMAAPFVVGGGLLGGAWEGLGRMIGPEDKTRLVDEIGQGRYSDSRMTEEQKYGVSRGAAALGVDPRYVLSDFSKESSYGTTNGKNPYWQFGMTPSMVASGGYNYWGYKAKNDGTFADAAALNAASWSYTLKNMKKKGLSTADPRAVMMYHDVNDSYTPPAGDPGNPSVPNAWAAWKANSGSDTYVPDSPAVAHKKANDAEWKRKHDAQAHHAAGRVAVLDTQVQMPDGYIQFKGKWVPSGSNRETRIHNRKSGLA